MGSRGLAVRGDLPEGAPGSIHAIRRCGKVASKGGVNHSLLTLDEALVDDLQLPDDPSENLRDHGHIDLLHTGHLLRKDFILLNVLTNASLFRQGKRLDLARFKVHGIATKSIRALNHVQR